MLYLGIDQHARQITIRAKVRVRVSGNLQVPH
jgi:hypothetical protein